jgi:glycosyltransferase involved in cell wall biosynthesis
MNSAPKLSVCVVTYNHEKFITDCVESIVAQELEHAFEVLVGDDCSTDATPVILRDLAQRDDRIRIVSRPKNVGAAVNFAELHNQARGELVAHLDGDDMAAPGKLAAQVRLLDANTDLVACAHKMQLMQGDGALLDIFFPHRLEPRFGLEKLVRVGMPVFTSSLMYRASARTNRELDAGMLDWLFLYRLMENGDVGYIDETLGFHRINDHSVSRSLGERGMLKLVAEVYARQFENTVKLSHEFAANAAITVLISLRKGAAVQPPTWRMLRHGMSLSSIGPMVDAVRWAVENRPTFVR